MIRRAVWTDLSDAQLLAQCEVDTYRASGPGGQKRNKTSSAVRLRHAASGLIVIAEESRSQHENRTRALKRLRQALFLKIREDLENPAGQSLHGRLPLADGRLKLGRKDPLFWPTAGFVLDVFHSLRARLSETAAALGITTANLVTFLHSDPKLWQEANHLRAQFGQKSLK